MKKRVISWLLCLALCLSMLPMAALAEDVQAPEGPAPSMNEPQPEPRAKENETPAPEPEKKVQSELMTAEKLLMPLAEDTPFTISFTATQNGNLITDEKPGVLSGGEVTLTVRIHLSDVSLRNDIIKAAQQSTLQVDNNNITFAGVGAEGNDTLVITITFAASSESHSVKYLITYNNQETTAECTLRFGVCSHLEASEVNGKFKCTECGAALVAELTAGASSSATTYYDALKDALDAAREADAGSTVTLLADCSLGSYELRKGSFMLDLDGHTLTQPGNPLWVSGTANLTVNNNNSGAINCGRFCVKSKTATLSVTIGSKYEGLMTTIAWQNVSDFLDSNMGYQINKKWADALAIRGMSIENVTVEKAPFTTSDITVSPENAYVNREATLSVTLSEFQAGTEATCEYSVRYGTNYTYQKSLKKPTYTADQAFAVEFTPSEEKYYIQAVITSGDFSVVKTLEKTFNTCTHGYGLVDRDGHCRGCDSQMAASVSSTHYVDGRKYYETFDLALSAAWDVLKNSDCWFTMFQDAQVGTIEYQYLNVLGGKTLYMDLNGQTLTSRGVAFRVPAKEWKLDLTNGTVIGNTSGYTGVYGVIEVAAGGSLNVHGGTITIQNKGAATKGINAPSIMVHGYSPSTGAEVRGVANIAGDEKSNFGSLFISGGKVTVNGGTYDQAKVTYGGSLKVFSGTFQGDVTVDDHALLDVGSTNAYFDGKLTFESEGMGRLSLGNYKHIKTEDATLGKLNNNYAYVFMNGGVYVPDARNLPELIADKGKYITIESHRHDFSNNGKCWCGAEAEAYLWMNGPQNYGYFDDMLALAEKAKGSCVYLRRDVTIRDTTVKEGNFSIAGGGFKVTCSGSSALIFSGGTVSIGDGTFDRLKVTDNGKLTLNGGKYYAIDVTGSTYENYGQLLPDGYAFKASTGWEAKGDITEESFASDTAKEVKILPLRSVTISPDGETTVPYGTSVKFTATVEANSSSGTTYKWFCDGVEILDETTNELTVTKDIGSYEYRCDVTRDGYTLSSNTVQLTVQRIDLSDAALSATIQTREYNGKYNATIEDGSSLTLGNMTVPASAYTLSAVFADRNVGADKDVTVKVTLTNPNYCFGYDANNQPIMEKTFETTGTITQNTQSNLISKDENIYNSAANTYEFDLDSYLTAIKDDLGTMSYGTPQPQSLQSGIGTPVLEGHTLKLPVSAMLWTSPIELGKITIPVNSQNYANVSIEICLKLVERTAVTATATPSKTELTYGERLDTITLSGKTTPELQGTFVWQKPDAILDVGTYTELGWKFTPVDYTYAEASGTAKITVKQAKLQDPAPMTLMIYNGWAATYEAALPKLPTLKEGLHFGNDAAYGTPDVSADGYYSSGAELKTVNGKQDVSIPILKNETTKEGQAGTITVQYTSQNYEPVTLAINLVAKNRTAPTFILTADHDTLSGGGKVTLTLERGNLPDGAVVMVSGTDEAGNAVTLTDNGDGTYSATLPNKTQTYTFIAVYDGSQTIAPKTDVATVKVQQRSSGGGEPAKPSFPVKISNSGDKKTAEIDLSGTKSGITDVTLPTDAVKKIVDSDVVSLTVKLPDVTVSFDDKALAAVAEQSSGADLSLSVNVGTANNSNLTDAQKNAITGARELSVIEVSLSSNGEKISNFNGGSVTIDVPFQWSMKGLLRAYYIDENGNKSAIDVTYKNGVATLVLNHFSTYVVEAVDALSFTDVSAKAYHFDAVAWAVKNKITSGQSDTLFAPDASCTRAQMVTFLWRANGSPEPTVTELPFTDVAADAYYAKAVLWAVENGITTGTSDTTFDPDGVVTRAEAVTFLWRSAGNPAAEGKLFADVESTKYYAEAVRWAVANGVTKGVSDTSFAPGSACTRAQIVTFLYRNCTNK